MSSHCTKAYWGALVFGIVLLASSGLDAGQVAVDGSRKVTRKIVPVYPQVAKQWHLTATVKMTATVTPDGVVKAVTILGGSPVFVPAAEQAVRQWKYEPAVKETTEAVVLVFRDTP